MPNDLKTPSKINETNFRFPSHERCSEGYTINVLKKDSEKRGISIFQNNNFNILSLISMSPAHLESRQ